MASQTKPGPLRLPGAAGPAASLLPAAAPHGYLPPGQGDRLWFVDHLRLVLICGVVVAHVASLYAGGGWYQYHDPAQADMLSRDVLMIPSLIANMFGMGFFFLLAGYFTLGSNDRKGGASFLRDRLLRLGVPLLVYNVLLDPLVVYVARGRPGSYWSFYGPYLLQVRTIGPVVAWRSLTRKRSHAIHRPATLPSTRAVLGFIVALSLASFVVRLWWPLRWDWSPPWWMQLFSWTGGLLPQYLSLYVLGCMAYRRNWFAQLTPRMGRAWSLPALIAMIVAVPFMIVGMATGTLNDFTGGFHWQALLMAVWEAFLVVGSQKIVPDLETAFRRIRHYVLPWEDAQVRKVMNIGSFVGKILLVEREWVDGRMTVILVRQPIGI